MNPKHILLIDRVFQFKAQKYPTMEYVYIRATDFLKALVCDFERIDVEIHSVLVEKMNFHHLSTLNTKKKVFKT